MAGHIKRTLLAILIIALSFSSGSFIKVDAGTDSNGNVYPDALSLPDLTGYAGDDFLAVAKSQLGYTASDNNLSSYWVWAGFKGSTYAWCTEFVAWCGTMANVEDKVLIKWSSKGYRECYSELGRYYSLKEGCSDDDCGCVGLSSDTISVNELQPGDILLIDTNDNMSDGPDHTAIVLSVENDVIHTIEGNVRNGGDVGTVALKDRLSENWYKFHGVCRPFETADFSGKQPELKTPIVKVKPEIIKKSAVNKKSRTAKITVKGSDGRVSYKLMVPSKRKKYVRISKKGIVTIKKKAPKGIYKIKVKVTAYGEFKAIEKIVKITVK